MRSPPRTDGTFRLRAEFGNPSPDVPAVGFFGGIHGLERIGTQVLLAFLHSLLRRLRWDQVLQRQLAAIRLVFMPLVNPAGMWRGTRSNPHGVDLMRNAPVESHELVPYLLGGQRISARLPWYRGAAGACMEIENQAVCSVVEEELSSREFSLALDCHSGFGLRDRIWFPYGAHGGTHPASCRKSMPCTACSTRPTRIHNYLFEPQCPAIPGARRSVGSPLPASAAARAARVSAAHPGNGFVAVGQEEPAATVFASGVSSIAANSSPATGAAQPPGVDGFSGAGGRLASALVAGSSRTRTPSAGGARALVLNGERMTTWVFLRGLMREARHWGEFTAAFQGSCRVPR